VAVTLPSEVLFPSGAMIATASTAVTAAAEMLEIASTRRRSNRSIRTPMNGDRNVYGT
jgi:hypothetical protein